MHTLRTLAILLFVSITTAGSGQSMFSDTLRSVTNTQERINNVRLQVTHKIDSVKGVANPNRFLLAQLDSINAGLDSLQAGLRNRVEGKLNTLTELEKSIDKKIDVAEKSLNDKLGLFSKNGADVGTLNIGLPNMKLPSDLDVGTKLGVLKDLGATSLAGKLKTPDFKIPAFSTRLSSIPSFNKIDALKGTAAIGKVKDIAGKIGSVNVNDPSGIEKQVESKVMSMDELKDLEASTLPVKDYTELSKQVNTDPHMAKELALNKAKESAVNHFAGHDKELKSGMDKLSQMKKKYKVLGTSVDMFKKPADPIKEKPFIERLYPGIDLQAQAKGNTWLTFTANFAYRLRLRWTIGAGWNERISMNIKNRQWIGYEHAYGPQAYGEFMARKNLAVRIESDNINSSLAADGGRSWRWSHYVGIRKMFNISKKTIGSVHLLYNVARVDEHFFDTQRLIIRTGIQFRLKRQK